MPAEKNLKNTPKKAAPKSKSKVSRKSIPKTIAKSSVKTKPKVTFPKSIKTDNDPNIGTNSLEESAAKSFDKFTELVSVAIKEVFSTGVTKAIPYLGKDIAKIRRFREGDKNSYRKPIELARIKDGSANILELLIDGGCIVKAETANLATIEVCTYPLPDKIADLSKSIVNTAIKPLVTRVEDLINGLDEIRLLRERRDREVQLNNIVKRAIDDHLSVLVSMGKNSEVDGYQKRLAQIADQFCIG
jgi:hypothetical protein